MVDVPQHCHDRRNRDECPHGLLDQLLLATAPLASLVLYLDRLGRGLRLPRDDLDVDPEVAPDGRRHLAPDAGVDRRWSASHHQLAQNVRGVEPESPREIANRYRVGDLHRGSHQRRLAHLVARR